MKIELDPKINGIVEVLSKLVDDGNLEIDENGIRCNKIDDGRIALLLLNIDKSDCNIFEVDPDIKEKIGLNFGDLLKVLKRGKNKKKQDRITLTKVKNGINVNFYDDERDKTRDFMINILKIKDDGIKPDVLTSIEYNSHFQISYPELGNIIKDCDIYSEVVNFTYKPGGVLTVKTEGPIGKYVNEIEYCNNQFEDKMELDCMFAIEFLKVILKSHKIFSGTFDAKCMEDIYLDIYISQETPIKFKVNFLSNSYFEFYLAPRVEAIEYDECPHCFEDIDNDTSKNNCEYCHKPIHWTDGGIASIPPKEEKVEEKEEVKEEETNTNKIKEDSKVIEVNKADYVPSEPIKEGIKIVLETFDKPQSEPGSFYISDNNGSDDWSAFDSF